MDLGESVLENDGSTAVKVYLRKKFAPLSEDLKSNKFTGILTNLADNEKYEIPFEYRDGELSCRISSKSRKLFSLYVYRNDADASLPSVTSSCIRFAVRGHSKKGDVPRLRTVLSTKEEKSPLAVGLMQYHYWVQMGDEVKVSVSYSGEKLLNYPVCLSAPGGIEIASKTDNSGTVTFTLPKIPLHLFENKFDQLPVVIWSTFIDPQLKTRYIDSESLMVHTRHYGGEYFKDARLWVLTLMAAFVLIFLFLKRNRVSGEDY